jgi:hypothetical protein
MANPTRGFAAMPNINRTQAALRPTPADVARRWAWIGLLGGASSGFSLVFACATPFVALVTLAALNMSRRDAFIVTGAVWLANQAVGYGILGYPRTFDSYAWGVAIGVAVLLALLVARAIGERFERNGPFVSTGFAFLSAFAVYELALYVASFWLSSSDPAFSWLIVGYILQVNALGLVGLAIVRLGASAIGLETRPSAHTASTRGIPG